MLPEVRALIGQTRHDTDWLLLELLWRTGARSSEAIALSADSFVTEDERVFAIITRLRARGRPRKRAPPSPRRVPIADAAFIERLQRYIATHRPRGRLFQVTRQTVANRLRRAGRGLALPFAPTPERLRHSFAVNCLLHGVPIRVLQSWLGHAALSSTERYAGALESNTEHFVAGVAF